ncbi:hypothetical protein [Candidatus Similichlamydia epinepheli]|uniref:hypothetical protein n=1 Tax=Candidatus Similichlamydia epinepheli TaxID=1903953 RepID=UPI000D35505B|nr:hypothetical protein [Candidatus Similichlamydia epinepheli]
MTDCDYGQKSEQIERSSSYDWKRLEKEKSSLALAAIQQRAKLLQSAYRSLDDQKTLSDALSKLLMCASNMEGDPVKEKERTSLLNEMQIVLNLFERNNSSRFDGAFRVFAYRFLKTGQRNNLEKLIEMLLETYEEDFQKKSSEALAKLEASSFYPSDMTSTHDIDQPIKPSLAPSLYNLDPKIFPTESLNTRQKTLHTSPYVASSSQTSSSIAGESDCICDERLIAILSHNLDRSDQTIHSMLDSLEDQNTARTSLRLLLQKIPTLPDRVTSIDDYPEIRRAIQAVSEKLSDYDFSWNNEEEKRTVMNGVLHTLTENSYETKLIYSRMSQEVSRRAELVKVFGHIVNSIFDCEMKFLKNMRW